MAEKEENFLISLARTVSINIWLEKSFGGIGVHGAMHL